MAQILHFILTNIYPKIFQVMAFNLQLDTTALDVDLGPEDSVCDSSFQSDELEHRDTYEIGDTAPLDAGLGLEKSHEDDDQIELQPGIKKGEDPVELQKQKDENSNVQPDLSDLYLDIEMKKAELIVETCTQSSSETEETDKPKDHQSPRHPEVHEPAKEEKIPKTRLRSAIDRSTSRKLSVHETLAARLNRIELDKDNLRKELTEMKNTLKEACNNTNNNGNMVQSESLEQVQSRISIVETFLSGFGVLSNESFPAEISWDIAQPSQSTPDDTSNIILSDVACGDNFDAVAVVNGNPMKNQVGAVSAVGGDSSSTCNAADITPVRDTSNIILSDAACGDNFDAVAVANGNSMTDQVGTVSAVRGDSSSTFNAADITPAEDAETSSSNEIQSSIAIDSLSGIQHQVPSSGLLRHDSEESIENSSTGQGPEPTNIEENCSPEAVVEDQHDSINDYQHQSQSPPLSVLGRTKSANDTNSSGKTTKHTDTDKEKIEVVQKPENRRQSSSFSKQQNLLLYLLDQEDRFKENVTHILARIGDLENNWNSQVTRKLTDQFPPDPEQTEIDTNKQIVDKNPDILHGIESHPSSYRRELDSLREILEKMTKDMETKASMDMANKEISAYLFEATQPSRDSDEEISRPITPNFSQEDLHKFKISVQRQLKFLNDQKIDKDTFLRELSTSKESTIISFNEVMGSSEARMDESLIRVQCGIDECKDSIRETEKRSFEANSLSDDLNIDERIRDATLSVQSNLNEVFSSRLEGLKQVEDEMEKVASQLAEKPDQDQINTMLQNLEKSVLKHVGIDEDLKSVLDTVKTDLKQKLTKEQVLGLVKQLIRGAKEGITKNTASLMVGYKCLGCNEIHPHGVNKFMASKVNHNALPCGRNITPPVYPYHRSSSDAKTRPLAPLRKMSSTTLGFRHPRLHPRPRTSPIGYHIHGGVKGNR